MNEKSVSLPQRLLAETLGTAFLLAAVVGSGIMAQRLSGGNGALALLCNTLPTGAILTVLILTFGPLSGAHFNPAVSVAFAMRGGLPWRTAGYYVAAQIIGAKPRYQHEVGAAHHRKRADTGKLNGVATSSPEVSSVKSRSSD